MMKQEKKENLSERFAKMGGRSLFRVEVMKISSYYGMLDENDPEDQKDIPYQGTDNIFIECAYEVYVLEEADVMAKVKRAVKSIDGLYRIRVYQIPLNILLRNGHALGVKVFNSKGEEMGTPEDNRFEPGDIVEYYNSENQKIQLAVVYNIIENSEEEDCDGNRKEYRLLAKEQGMMQIYVQAADVSAPSFPVSETFRKELDDLYRKKLEDEENGTLSFAELLDLL